MIDLFAKYRVLGRRSLLRAVIQALHLRHRPFITFVSAAGALDLFEVGERHELLNALKDLEYRSPWTPGDASPAPPLRDLATGQPAPSGSARAAQVASDPIERAAGSPRHRATPGEAVTKTGRARPAAMVAPPGRMPTSVSTAWRPVIQRVYVPALWPAGEAMSGRRQSSQRDEASPAPAATNRTTLDPREWPAAATPTMVRLEWPARSGRTAPQPSASAILPPRQMTTPGLSAVAVPGPDAGTPPEGAAGGPAAAPWHDGIDLTWRFLVLQSTGTPLGIFQRVRLEPFFPGLDLADVRVHADEPADRAARALQADAFSLGRDIFFRARQFDPSTPSGLALIGHELTHALQRPGGEPIESTSALRELEGDAQSVEMTVLRTFTAGRAGPPQAPLPAIGHRYMPLSLEPVRPPVVTRPDGSSAAGAPRGSDARHESPGPSVRAQPLKAEQGRPSPAAGTSTAGSSSGGDDPERAVRSLFRILQRKLLTDKERRGVDRWVR